MAFWGKKLDESGRSQGPPAIRAPDRPLKSVLHTNKPPPPKAPPARPSLPPVSPLTENKTDLPKEIAPMSSPEPIADRTPIVEPPPAASPPAVSATPAAVDGEAIKSIERSDDTGRSQFFAGRGVKLKAEVSGCDIFRIEGDFEGVVLARRMLIAPTGVFKGTGTVEEAVVEGRIDGKLAVTGTLAVKSTGRVTGSVSYGQIEIERGGHLHGDIAPKSAEPQPAKAAATDGARAPAPKPVAMTPPPLPAPEPLQARKSVLTPLSLGSRRTP